MNYRHAYHAGNFADLVKHAVLTLLIAHLKRKETPFHLLDTHAGIGRYDLEGLEAGKTNEAEAGIRRLAASGPLPAVFAHYEAILRTLNPGWPEVRHYPGSPAITAALLRPQDRATLVELHPEDAATLRRHFRGDRRVRTVLADGYGALKAELPPKERRGLVLIDPPFEEKDEFQRLARGLAEGLRRWETGIFAIWYPIKNPEFTERFLGEVTNFALPCFTAEFYLTPPDDPDRLNGCGMLVINPPWKLDEDSRAVLSCLKDRLVATGDATVRWLIPAR